MTVKYVEDQWGDLFEILGTTSHESVPVVVLKGMVGNPKAVLSVCGFDGIAVNNLPVRVRPVDFTAKGIDTWWVDAPFVRVIGDIHGVYASFRSAVANARRGGGKIFCLGDLINRGTHSIDCMRLAVEGAKEGWLKFVPGNHDHRLALWRRMPHHMNEEIFKDKTALKTTLREIDALTDLSIVDEFCDLALATPVWHRAGNVFFAHAMVSDPAAAPPLLCSAVRVLGDLGGMAICGQAVLPAGRLDVSWLERMPTNSLTFVGHVPLSRSHPVKITGLSGAVGVFMDTGCGLMNGQEGPLSWVDVTPADLLCPSRIAAGLSEADPKQFHPA